MDRPQQFAYTSSMKVSLEFRDGSPAIAKAAAAKLIAEKRKGGYVETGNADAKSTGATAFCGGVFFKANGGITANKLVAQLREDGTTSKANPRTREGFGDDGVVGLAVTRRETDGLPQLTAPTARKASGPAVGRAPQSSQTISAPRRFGFASSRLRSRWPCASFAAAVGFTS